MKKLLFTLLVVILTIFFNSYSNSQSSGARSAVLLTGGLSQITGYGGLEWYDGISSLDLGVGTITAPLNDKSEVTFGIGLSFYTRPENKSSFYGSIGWTQDGAYYDYVDSWGNNVTEFANTWTLMFGGRLAGNSIISLKGGLGYAWSSVINSPTFEVKLGIRIWHKN